MPAERSEISFRTDCGRMNAERYQKIHHLIIERARRRTLTVYFERHHIQPRSLGGSDDRANLVDLTYREHFLAHWLLTKIHAGHDRRKMVMALHCMTMPLRESGRFVTGWRVELSKRLLRDEWTKRAHERRLAKAEEHRREMAATAAMLARTEANKALADEWREQNGGNLIPRSKLKDHIGRFLPPSFVPLLPKKKRKRPRRSKAARNARRQRRRQKQRAELAAIAA